MAWIPVENNSCSIWISREITTMWSIINLISCNTPIIDVKYHTPYFDLFVWWSWSMPEKVTNTTMKHILSLAGEPNGILIGESPKFFLVTWFQYKNSGDIRKYIIWDFTFPILSKDTYPPVVRNRMFMLWHLLKYLEDLASDPSSSTQMNANFLSWLLNEVTIIFNISRDGRLILDGNPKGHELAEHIATKVEVNPQIILTLKIEKSIWIMKPGANFETSMVVPLWILVALVNIQIGKCPSK